MTSSKKTANYTLSQFANKDRPSFLVDYNSDMAKIDAQLKKNANAAAAAASGNVKAYTKEESDAKYMPKTSAYTKTEADSRYAPKAVAAPEDSALGITAEEWDRLYVDSNGIVRHKPLAA